MSMSDMSASVPNVTLNNGVTIPQVGYGVFQIPPEETQQAVESALEAGYRHIDTAAGYNNEEGVGAAIRASGLPAEDVFVTTKLLPNQQGFDSSLKAFDDSRKALGVDVIDLYLIHWPAPGRDQYVETWKAFEQLLSEGSARSIGVSNFLPEHLQRLINETDITPAVNQIELHPSFQQPATQQAGRDAGVATEAYAPLGQGVDLNAPEVTQVAERLGVTAGQVVLRWHIQQGTIVIPKSVTPERIVSNFDLFSFELTDADMAGISGLDSAEGLFPNPAEANFD